MGLEDTVKGLINGLFKREEKQIELSTNAKLKEIGLSSLDFVMLIVKIEEEFNIEYPDEALIMTNEMDINYILGVIRHCINVNDHVVE